MELLKMLEIERNKDVRVIFERKQNVQWSIFMRRVVCFPVILRLVLLQSNSERFQPFINSFFDEREELWNLLEQMSKTN